ncbi:MAG: YceI family protein, partial [Pseudomonadota bacterium]
SGEAWIIDHEASSLGFTITFTGSPVEGSIATWSGDVVFDPANLDDAEAVITIDAASISIANPMLQPQAGGADGFDAANHPVAIYEANAFRANDDGSFSAEGELTLRGVTADAPLAFTFEETDGVARVVGAAEINRLDFGIGAVGAADESWLQHTVTVEFTLQANRP